MQSEETVGVAKEGPSVVVVGASAAGMFAAMALARAGCAVTVLERDEARLPDGVDGAFGWPRSGTPQLHHTHFFLTRLRVELGEHFPDLLEALYRAGGTNRLIIGPGFAGVGPEAGDDGPDDLRLLAMRRTTFEWVLRSALLEEPGVQLHTGAAVAGLVARHDEGDVPVVTGVELDNGTTIEADLVVATTGRRSDIAAWLTPHGATPQEHLGTNPNIVYFTRFYRLVDGMEFPTTGTVPGRGRAGVFCGVSPADHGTFSVIMAIDTDDTELRSRLRDPDSFEAVGRLFPETEPWLRPGLAEPITEVNMMAGLQNRTRSLVTEAGDPMVEGFHLLGDAHTVTNPLYGRGCTLAAIQSGALADAVTSHIGNPDAVARAYAEANSRLVEPWYRLSVEMDSLRQRMVADDPGSKVARWPLAEVMAASTLDPDVGAAFARLWVMLDEPTSLFEDPELTQRATEANARRPKRRPSDRPPEVITRDRVVEVAQHPAMAGR